MSGFQWQFRGRVVPRMGLGCFPLTGGYGSIDRDEGARVIHAALDAGLSVLDTSDAYAAGANEELVGGAIADRRAAAILCTKFGWTLDASGNPAGLDSSPDRVRTACEASLRRLRTDYIDIYIQHRRDPAVPIEETVGEMSRLQAEGKIRGIGLSEVAADTLVRAHGVTAVDVLQTEYSLWSRDAEPELLPKCLELGVTFMAYSPLGRGFLAGAIRSSADLAPSDFRRTNPRFQDESLAANRALVDQLEAIAQRLGRTTSQLALAWLLGRPWGVLPIPATRRLEHLRANVEALSIALTPEQMDEIASAVPPSLVRGARHPAEHMKTINR